MIQQMYEVPTYQEFGFGATSLATCSGKARVDTPKDIVRTKDGAKSLVQMGL